VREEHEASTVASQSPLFYAGIRQRSVGIVRTLMVTATFVYEDGVEPTNNAAERALRTAIQWRKIMFGTRSAEGEGCDCGVQ
jgi:hypothetical protein